MVAAALLVTAAVCLGLGLTGHQRSLAAPVTHRTPPASARAEPTRARPVPAVARSVPVSLSIPAIDVSVTVSVLGLNPTGTVEVPTDYQQPGWYHLGPSPGQLGSAVILGHVDTYQGPAVFFRLRTLVAGDKVAVTLADGVVTTFAVDSVAMYPKTQFPAAQVYGSHDDSALQLVTCGGTFDAETGHYLSNVVVYSTLVTATPESSPLPGTSRSSTGASASKLVRGSSVPSGLTAVPPRRGSR